MVNEVYKYVPPERMDILKSKRICFSKKEQLNDSFEFELEFKICGDEGKDLDYMIAQFCSSPDLEEQKNMLMKAKEIQEFQLNRKFSFEEYLYYLSENNPEINERIKGYIKATKHLYSLGVIDNLCVLSLTNRWDSNYMWGHYASSSKGFMIGFDKKHAFFDRRVSKDDMLRSLHNVIYHDEPPVVYINNTLNKEGTVSNHMFYNKHTDHKQEEECRIIDSIDNASFVTETGYHLFDIPKGLITSITLGHNTKQEDEEEIKNLIMNDDFFEGTQLFKASPDSKNRKIDRYPLID
ncbi:MULTISPECIES: DUF2971 domain-containing protein [Providencia]|uniref:DUF2971 domain-containing protein n=1 Tax=Providencia TaxID=586 RepID=UPI00234BA0A5|nr:DUF2971 domain-containing protein [Providencia sp. PROV122]